MSLILKEVCLVGPTFCGGVISPPFSWMKRELDTGKTDMFSARLPPLSKVYIRLTNNKLHIRLGYIYTPKYVITCSNYKFYRFVWTMVFNIRCPVETQSGNVYTKNIKDSVALRSGSTVTNEVNPRCGYC